MTRLAQIELPEETLLGMLQLQGGKVHRAWMDEQNAMVHLIVAHPEAPEVADGMHIASIQLVFQTVRTELLCGCAHESQVREHL